MTVFGAEQILNLKFQNLRTESFIERLRVETMKWCVPPKCMSPNKAPSVAYKPLRTTLMRR